MLSSGTQLGALQNLSVVARRWRRIAIQINDQTGTAVDLSTYDAWRIGIRSSDGASKWESGIGTHKVTGLNISGDAAGLLTVELPENLSRATARGNTTAYALGDVVQAGDLVAICTTAGTSAGSAPTWPTTAGQSVSDGTVTWETLSDPWELFDSALAADPNLTQLNLRYEIAANDSGNVARTVPIIRSSTLSVSGYEVATTYEDPSA